MIYSISRFVNWQLQTKTALNDGFFSSLFTTKTREIRTSLLLYFTIAGFGSITPPVASLLYKSGSIVLVKHVRCALWLQFWL